MDKQRESDIMTERATAAILVGIQDIAHTQTLLLLRQWLTLLHGLAVPFGGPERLLMSRAILSLEAQPADDECRCDQHRLASQLVRARLTVTRPGGIDQRVAGRAAMPGLTLAWSMLTDLVQRTAPGHQHAGFVVDYGARVVGCWHDWACLECSGGLPCLTIDISGVLAWDATGASPGMVDCAPVASLVPVSQLPEPGDSRGPRSPASVPSFPAVRGLAVDTRECAVILMRRMQEVGIPLPCEARSYPHTGLGEGAA